MDKIKDPAMVLSTTSLIGLIGTTTYFFQQISTIKSDMLKMSDALTKLAIQVRELHNGDEHKNEALQMLGEQVKSINQKIELLPSIDDIQDISEDLEGIVETLQDNNIEATLQSQQPKKRRNKNSFGSTRDRSYTKSKDEWSRNSGKRSRIETLQKQIENEDIEEEVDLIEAVRRQTRN
jgi:cell fate (sporulation/competence/biofilm development) regulator YmcA (YheA/YmcA/DUF963 family)